MRKNKRLRKTIALMCAVGTLSGSFGFSVCAEGRFDSEFYAATYPDVVAVFGTDAQALLKHYQDYGQKEGRLPYAGAEPGTAVEGIETAAVSPQSSQMFDPAFYAAAYPDVVAVFGTDAQALLKHYQDYGKREGRLPYAGAEPGAATEGIADTTAAAEAAGLVPLNKLANLSSLRKRATNAELEQAYQAAVPIVTPYIGRSRQEQILGITSEIRYLFDSGIAYSMSAPHYDDPYGYLILRTASCAGCARATGLCLNMLGIPYEHVNENQYTHQWCRVNVDGEYWISDAYGLYCGPEPAPYTHPYL